MMSLDDTAWIMNQRRARQVYPAVLRANNFSIMGTASILRVHKNSLYKWLCEDVQIKALRDRDLDLAIEQCQWQEGHKILTQVKRVLSRMEKDNG